MHEILIGRQRNDSTVRYALSRAGSLMAVATSTYDSLPDAEKHALPAANSCSPRSTTLKNSRCRAIGTDPGLSGRASTSAHSVAAHGYEDFRAGRLASVRGVGNGTLRVGCSDLHGGSVYPLTGVR
jgi:hypothetical protein